MSSVCTFELAGYPVEETKYYPIPELMVFFRERDRRVFVRKVSERNPLVWGNCEETDSEEEAYIYSIETCQFNARMDLLGFTLATTKSNFEESKLNQLEFMKGAKNSLKEPLYDSDIDLLTKATFEDFLTAFQTIRERRVKRLSNDLVIQHDDSRLIRRLFQNNRESFDFFPCEDIRHFVRAFAETCPEQAFATYDLTDIVHAGYYEPDDPIAELATQALIGEYPRHGKIIILTEGKTDRHILEQTLELLYPHLSDYFSFMDFDGSKAEGGAGALMNTLRSFIGAGVLNRMIALFDNDTAGAESIHGLAQINVPENIKIMRLPNIDSAKNYPTLGPQGIVLSDINGLACAIELYLGRDVLETNGDLVPVQWTGFSRSAKNYQGVLVNKGLVHGKFFEKLKECKRDPNKLNDFDWVDLRAIFLQIFSAFH